MAKNKKAISFDSFFDRDREQDKKSTKSFVDGYTQKPSPSRPSSRRSNRHSGRPDPALADVLSDPLADLQKPPGSSRPSSRPENENPITIAKNITDIQAIILCHLLEAPDSVYRAKILAQKTNIKYASVRFSIMRLVELGFITKPTRYKNFGAAFSIKNYTLCEAFKAHRLPEIISKYGHPPSSRPSNRPETEGSARRSASLIIEEESINNNSLLLANGLADLLADQFPVLHKLGLRKTHLVNIANAWNDLGLDTNDLSDSLERANYDMKNKTYVEKPLAYVFTALKKGPYEKPKGFVSKAEKAAKQKAEEIKAARKWQKQANETAEKSEREMFESWWDSLSEPEQNKIDNQLNVDMSKTGAKLSLRFARMDYYKKNVKGE
jgi:hypothetical protein